MHPRSSAAFVAFISLAVLAAACRVHVTEDGWGSSSAGVRRGGDDGGDPGDATRCGPGEPCDIDCVAGRCEADCGEASSCTVDCVGGGCDVDCGAGEDCDVDCVGGGCFIDCGAAESCNVDCVAGDCEVRCNGASCDVDCVAGDCDVRR